MTSLASLSISTFQELSNFFKCCQSARSVGIDVLFHFTQHGIRFIALPEGSQECAVQFIIKSNIGTYLIQEATEEHHQGYAVRVFGFDSAVEFLKPLVTEETTTLQLVLTTEFSLVLTVNLYDDSLVKEYSLACKDLDRTSEGKYVDIPHLKNMDFSNKIVITPALMLNCLSNCPNVSKVFFFISSPSSNNPSFIKSHLSERYIPQETESQKNSRDCQVTIRLIDELEEVNLSPDCEPSIVLAIPLKFFKSICSFSASLKCLSVALLFDDSCGHVSFGFDLPELNYLDVCYMVVSEVPEVPHSSNVEITDYGDPIMSSASNQLPSNQSIASQSYSNQLPISHNPSPVASDSVSLTPCPKRVRLANYS
ncbi:hypothetical protein P9112_007910 [Eukaryota sp. TZLM1-RC]